MTFLLDARLELTPDEQELFERYRLYDTVIYDSDSRVQHDHAAMESFEAASESAEKVPLVPPLEELHLALGNFFATLWHTSAGGVYSFISSMSLQITLQSLVDGQHLERAKASVKYSRSSSSFMKPLNI